MTVLVNGTNMFHWFSFFCVHLDFFTLIFTAQILSPFSTKYLCVHVWFVLSSVFLFVCLFASAHVVTLLEHFLLKSGLWPTWRSPAELEVCKYKIRHTKKLFVMLGQFCNYIKMKVNHFTVKIS